MGRYQNGEDFSAHRTGAIIGQSFNRMDATCNRVWHFPWNCLYVGIGIVKYCDAVLESFLVFAEVVPECGEVGPVLRSKMPCKGSGPRCGGG